MLTDMLNAINHDYPTSSTLGIGQENSSVLSLSGEGEAKSCFPVAMFSQAAIASAVKEIQALIFQVWSDARPANINLELSAAWCQQSLNPINWSLPASWDEFAGDYQCRDGWIRLHTNAVHHRRAALRVLGNPESVEQAKDAVSAWDGLMLETAVVSEGGAAAFMMSREQWSEHEQGLSVASQPVVAWSVIGDGASRLERAFSDSRIPLKGIRILDLTRVLAGPVCTRFLASMGADVLRIDPPHWEEDGNALEMTVGKRCAGLDLTDSHDRIQFESLLAKADLIVHGYRRDALEGLGFGDEARQKINPNLIDVSLNAYGWSGPWKNRRGFDSLVQMSSGIACEGMESFNADKPVPLPYQALDHVTGYLMAAAVVRAIRENAHSGISLSARLSLARQARLLQDLSMGLGGLPGTGFYEDSLAPIKPEHFHTDPEFTPWGDIQRLKLPYKISGVELTFNRPVSRLRTDKAIW